ncbi:MAG: DUF4386 family protein [Tepidiformaceae bacterium]
MTAIHPQHDTMAASVARLWLRFYTLGMTADLRERREDQLGSDLWEHQVDRLGAGVAPSMVGLEVLGRMVRGMPADLLWRFQLEGPTMDIKIPFERATGLLLLLLGVLMVVSTSISGYDTARDGWEGELTRLGQLSDLAVTMNLVFQALAGGALIALAVLFYLALAGRSRNLAALAGAFMFTAGITTLAASVAYGVTAELADEYLAGRGDGVLTTSRAFALTMDAFVEFTILTLSLSVYVLAAVAHRESLVPRWTTGLAAASACLVATSAVLSFAADGDGWLWMTMMGGLFLMLIWLVVAGFTLLLGSRGKPAITPEPKLSAT